MSFIEILQAAITLGVLIGSGLGSIKGINYVNEKNNQIEGKIDNLISIDVLEQRLASSKEELNKNYLVQLDKKITEATKHLATIHGAELATRDARLKALENQAEKDNKKIDSQDKRIKELETLAETQKEKLLNLYEQLEQKHEESEQLAKDRDTIHSKLEVLTNEKRDIEAKLAIQVAVNNAIENLIKQLNLQAVAYIAPPIGEDNV